MTKTHHANKETKTKPTLTPTAKNAAILGKAQGGNEAPMAPKP